MWFIRNNARTDFCLLPHTALSYLYAPLNVLSNVQSNIIAHHLSPFSTTVTFFGSPLVKIKNVFPSMNFYHRSRMKWDQGNTEDIREQEWASSRCVPLLQNQWVVLPQIWSFFPSAWLEVFFSISDCRFLPHVSIQSWNNLYY